MSHASLLSLKICLVLTTFNAFSQNSNLNKAAAYYKDFESYNDTASLRHAKEKIDLAAVNESTKNKFKTWFYRGKIYLSLFELSIRNEMNNNKEAEINKKYISAYRNVSSAQLDEALNSFQKEIELDEKKNYSEYANTAIATILDHYNTKAYSCLINQNYSDAITFYEKIEQVKSKINTTDTVIVNNLAFSYLQIKNFIKAEEYYNKLIELKYKPEKYYLAIIQMYNEAGDTASVRRVLAKAVAEFPDNYALLIEQINLFVKEGKSQSSIQSINKALEKNPDSYELHLVLGQVYNKMAFPKDAGQKPDNSLEFAKKAEEEFNKALQINPDYLIALYSLGIFYNNMGADILRQSENLQDPKKVKAMESKADTLFYKAIPFLEKAHKLDPSDKDTIIALRQLYARTGQGDTEKYKKLNEELKKQ